MGLPPRGRLVRRLLRAPQVSAVAVVVRAFMQVLAGAMECRGVCAGKMYDTTGGSGEREAPLGSA